jgi:hypothetical protein
VLRRGRGNESENLRRRRRRKHLLRQSRRSM